MEQRPEGAGVWLCRDDPLDVSSSVISLMKTSLVLPKLLKSKDLHQNAADDEFI